MNLRRVFILIVFAFTFVGFGQETDVVVDFFGYQRAKVPEERTDMIQVGVSTDTGR